MTSNRFATRPLSHSQLSSWEYDKEQWYRSYILGERTPPNATMLAGTRIGDAIGTADCPLKQATTQRVHPTGIKEFKLDARLGDIYIIGYADHFDPTTRTLHENKTSTNKYRWNQRKVNEHGQMTMYALMLFLRHGVPPEEVTMYLNFLPTTKRLELKPEYVGIPDWAHDEHICNEVVELPDPVVWKQFPTTRTAADLEAYVEYVHTTVAAMDEYVKQRKS